MLTLLSTRISADNLLFGLSLFILILLFVIQVLFLQEMPAYAKQNASKWIFVLPTIIVIAVVTRFLGTF